MITGRLKIFHLLASDKWTGPAEGVVTLCRDLSKIGHQVRLYTMAYGGRRLVDQASARAVIPGEDLWLDGKHPLKLGWDVFRLKKILDREKPDILHVHRSEDHWVGALANKASSQRTHVIRTIHHPRTLERRPFRRWLYGSATDKFVTLRLADADTLQKGYGLDPGKVLAIPGAVDTMRFHPDHDSRSIRAEFGITPAAPVIGMVARFQSHRRHDVLISAMVKLRKMFPTVRLLLVGKGEHQPVLENQVRQLNLGKHVIFTGYRDRDLPEVYGAMNVSVLLATGSEVSCRAVLEAMACGLPVVAARVGALPETVLHGVTGRLVNESDPDDLIRCLADVLDDRNTARKMGEASRERAEEYFSEPVRVRKMEDFYRSMLS